MIGFVARCSTIDSHETTTPSSMPRRSGESHSLAAYPVGHSTLKAASNPEFYRHALGERRRTLHTISALSNQNVALKGYNSAFASSREKIVEIPASRDVKISRRNSIAIQQTDGGQWELIDPSKLGKSAEVPTLRRSLTDPSAWAQRSSSRPAVGSKTAEGNTSKRKSAHLSLRARSSQEPPLFPIAEGRQSDLHNFHPSSSPPPPPSSRNRTRGKRAPRLASGKAHHGKGWNAWRETERIKQEAFMAAKARREKIGHVAMGNPSALLSSCPDPAAKKELNIRKHRNQPQCAPDGQQASDAYPLEPPRRKASYGQTARQMNSGNANGHMPKHAPTCCCSHAVVPPRGVQRSHSVTSETSWKSYIIPMNPTPLPLGRSTWSDPFSSPMMPAQYKPGHVRSTSLPTVLSPSPMAARHFQRYSLPSVGSPPMLAGYNAQQNINKGRLEAFPALNHVYTHAKGYHLVSSTQPVQTSQEAAPAPDVPRTSARIRSQSASSSQPSVTRAQAATSAAEILYRENPDKRGFPVAGVENARYPRETEKSKPLNAGRQSNETQQSVRSKVRERARRASELEDEEAKGFVMEEKEMMAEEKEVIDEKESTVEAKKRWREKFWCGIFGK